MRWSLVAVGAPALAGCSLIYNPNNLPDPRIIDAHVVDADPCALEVNSIVPRVIDEGQGDNGSAPALLVVHGNNFSNTNLKVELKPQDGTTVVQLDPVTDALVSGDTTYLAFTVKARVDGVLGKAGAVDIPLDIVVTQDAPQNGSCMGATTKTLSNKLVLKALPELTSGPTTSQLYSMITLPDMMFTGPGRVELNAVSSITLGKVTASGIGTTAGPGAFPAGGDSGPGAGATGQAAAVLGNGGGGGGAGFTTGGGAGANATGNGGPGGRPYGEDQILSYSGNRASAGGMGGGGVNILGGTPGGAGGGGGGMVILTAGGDIKAMTVTANGGDGLAPSSGPGGGGGAGAGGTVVVRTSYGMLNVGTVRVAAGKPGTPGGGTGSVGRVRWDAPGDNAPVSPDRAAHRGPAFKSAPQVVTMQEPSFTVVGTPGDTIAIRVIDDRDIPHPGPEVSFNPAGLATIVPTLSPGHNQVCAKLAGGTESEAAANTCIDVAYLP